jgi:hypothetical protein
MTRRRARLAFTWDAIRTIPRYPQLIPMMAILAVMHTFIVIGCWWAGKSIDDLRRELPRRQRLRLLTGGDASPPG